MTAPGQTPAPSAHVISDPQTAPRLMLGWTMRYLAPFLGQEVTLSEAARELDVTLPRLHYQVRRLLEGGLLSVRGGLRGRRRVRLYRAVADTFFVPFELMPAETVAAGMAKADLPWLGLFLRSLERVRQDYPGEWGMWIGRGAAGGIHASIGQHAQGWSLEAPELPAVLLGGWVTDLQLDHDDAKALQRELGEVTRRYLGRGGNQRYLLQLRLAPLLADDQALPGVTSR